MRIPSTTSCVRFRRSRDARRLLVVAESVVAVVAQGGVERSLAGVPERRMAHVVAEPDRLGQVLVQPEGARDDASDARGLERVGHARAVVVAGRVDEDLCLPLQPPERLRVQDAVAVALKRRAHGARLLRVEHRPRVSYERTASGDRVGSSCSRTRAANDVADFPGKLRHRSQGRRRRRRIR